MVLARTNKHDNIFRNIDNFFNRSFFDTLPMQESAHPIYKRDHNDLKISGSTVSNTQYWTMSSKDKHVIAISAPGAVRESVSVEVDSNSLSVKWTQSVLNHKQDFHKTFTLPRGHDLDNATAKLENGILFMTVPFSTSPKKHILVE